MTKEEIIKKALDGDEKAIWLTAVMMLEMIACKTKNHKYQHRASKLYYESKEYGINWKE